MRTDPIDRVIDHLRRAVLPPDGAGPGDGELLGRFIDRRDEAALAALVGRHGPMVWGVCRRLLGHHDAEDAFQATFIVLARKAASIRSRGMVGNWLYGVAHQTALQARRAAARRRAREVQVTEVPDVEAVRHDRSPDSRPLLDEELSRLPEIYRAVIVLCELEGRSRKEAARQLGVPEGTVAGRLARARAMLAKRLVRRGVVMSGGALVGVSSAGSASASASPSLVASTIEVASLLAAGRAAGVVSVKVAALTEGVVRAMFVTKIENVLAAVLVVVVACGATGLICRTQAGGPQKAEKPAEQKKAGRKKAEKPAGQKAEVGGGKKAKTDPERLQGKWRIVSMGEGGDEAKLEGVQEADVTFKGDTVRFRFDVSNVDSPNFTTAYSRYRLDASSDPKSIEMVEGNAEELFEFEEVDKKFADADKHVRGIYAFDGGTLRLCFSTSGGKKGPTAFENTKESNTRLYVLERVADKGK